MKYDSADRFDMSSLCLHPSIARPCSWPASLKEFPEPWRKEANGRSFPWCGQSLRYNLDRWPSLQVNAPNSRVLHCPYNSILPQGSEFRSLLQGGHVISSMHAGWGGLASIVLLVFCIYQRSALTLESRWVRLHPQRLIFATSCKLTVPSITWCLTSTTLDGSFWEHRDNLYVCWTAVQKILLVTLFGEPMKYVENIFLGVTLDTRLTFLASRLSV